MIITVKNINVNVIVQKLSKASNIAINVKPCLPVDPLN